MFVQPVFSQKTETNQVSISVYSVIKYLLYSNYIEKLENRKTHHSSVQLNVQTTNAHFFLKQ